MKRLHLIYFVDAASTKTTSFRISSLVVLGGFLGLLILSNILLFTWFLKTKNHIQFLEIQNRDLKLAALKHSLPLSVAVQDESEPGNRSPEGPAVRLARAVPPRTSPTSPASEAVLPESQVGLAPRAAVVPPVAQTPSPTGTSAVQSVPLRVTNAALLATGQATLMEADLENVSEGKRLVGWVCGLLKLKGAGGGATTTVPPGLTLDKAGAPASCKGGQWVSFQRLRPIQILFPVPTSSVEHASLFFEPKGAQSVLSFPFSSLSKGNN